MKEKRKNPVKMQPITFVFLSPPLPSPSHTIKLQARRAGRKYNSMKKEKRMKLNRK